MLSYKQLIVVIQMHKMIWFQGKSILYPDLSYIQLSYKQSVLYRQTNRIVYDESYVVGSQEWMRKKEAEFEARKAHVREVCAKLKSKDNWRAKEQRYFWFDIKHGIALCAHAKV